MSQLDSEDTDTTARILGDLGGSTRPLLHDNVKISPSLGMRDIPRDECGVPSIVFGEMPAASPKGARYLELTMYWRDARMSVVCLEEVRPVTVGIGAVDLPATLPLELSDKFVIAEPSRNGVAFCFTSSMRVEIRGDDDMPLGLDRLVKLRRVDASALAGHGTHRVKLESAERIAIVMGDVTIAARWVAAPIRVKPLPFAWLDRNFAAVLTLVLLVHAIALTALLMTPKADNELPIEILDNPTRVAKLVLEQRAKKPPPPMRSDAAGTKGGKRAGDEGQVGRPTEKPTRDAAPSVRGTPRVDASKRAQDRRVALSSGLLQVLGDKPGGATSNVFGPGGLGSGINDALGGLRASKTGEAGGVGGAGGKGSLLGGGGKSLGIGGVGNGPGSGKGLANVELGGKGRATEVIPGRTVTKGCISQDVVGRVVARHNAQVKFCYDKELQKKPDLAGKLVAGFTIGGNGDVLESRVAESTLGDSAVEQCVLRVISHMRFPPCEGGGTADVTYPWLFKAGGQ